MEGDSQALKRSECCIRPCDDPEALPERSVFDFSNVLAQAVPVSSFDLGVIGLRRYAGVLCPDSISDWVSLDIANWKVEISRWSVSMCNFGGTTWRSMVKEGDCDITGHNLSNACNR